MFDGCATLQEMHVGHLRSTILGDSICRTLEYAVSVLALH
jgi:arginyl-tRNA synthetase